MKTYIALLRGINVGGHRKVPMADLRNLLTKIGLENVQTYIQSGNIVFQSKNTDKLALEALIHLAIRNHFDFEVPVLVRTRTDLKTIFDNCPFDKEEKEASYFSILSAAPAEQLVTEACEKTYADEAYFIIKDCIYFFSKNGYGRAKFSLKHFERKLKVDATARNFKTMLKLLSLSDI